MSTIIGIDLGGTTIKSALISKAGKIIKKYETATEAEKGASKVIKNIFLSI